MAELEEVVAGPSAAPKWRDDVLGAVIRLRGAFEAHVSEVEGPDGLLAAMVEEAPRISSPVAVLERDHRKIRSRIGELITAVASQDPPEIRAMALDVMRRVVVHRQRGAELVYDAYQTDIGGG